MKTQSVEKSPPTCPVCERAIIEGVRASQHHLTPKLKGGKGGPTALVHQMCHNEIHANYTEAELARDFATAQTLKSAPRLAKFKQWLSNKPLHFDARTQKNLRRQKKR